MKQIILLMFLLVGVANADSLPPCSEVYSDYDGCFDTWSYANGDKYVGEVNKGEYKHGQGTYTFADGRKYVGEFRDDKFHGDGYYRFLDNREVVGEWKFNRIWTAVAYDPDGKVVKVWTNGVPSDP